jgi:eukaryotic-like serine/threonine-protein kinase
MTNPFERNPFDSGSSGTQFAPPPAPRDEVNALATLSLVFAFVFAPAGAVLGHLGLSQIRRTGERGRDRALVGLTLSYVFITAAVVALVVGATLSETTPTRIAAPTTTSAIPTTTTTAAPPPPPTVGPADLDGLLPSLDDVKNITGDPQLTVHATYHQPTTDRQGVSIDRPDCWGTADSGEPDEYDMAAVVGYSESDFTDTHDVHNLWSTGHVVAAFHDAAAAQAQLAKLQSMWRKCSAASINLTFPNGATTPVFVKPPADAGNGISTLEASIQGSMRLYWVHAIAAKSNVFIDVSVDSTTSADRVSQATVAITNYILGKIPG